MKIAESQISMASSHELTVHVSERKTVIEAEAGEAAKRMEDAAAVFESSGGSISAALTMVQRQQERLERQQKKVQAWVDAQKAVERMHQSPQRSTSFWGGPRTIRSSILDQLLEMLGKRGTRTSLRIPGLGQEDALDLRGPAARTAGARAQMFGGSGVPVSGTTSAGTLWQRVTAASGLYQERERTTFAAEGVAVTGDGRRISLDVAFTLSRSSTARYDELTSESFLMTDPLMIQLDGAAPSVSDRKIWFDLDGDGEQEEIAFAGAGSGFLALDRDGDGVIGDGSELFGPQSGDGFADLAAYDEDGNGWIDEGDAVYADLRVWMRDADGNDRLLDLKEADVGAIYLGNAETQFSLKDADGGTSAALRRSGTYLRESGGAGTLCHVDLRS